MPNTKSAKKDLRRSTQRREHNRQVRSTLRTSLRRVRAAIDAGDAAAATTALREAVSKLDKAAKRNIVHQKTASRYQSRLAKRLQALTAKS